MTAIIVVSSRDPSSGGVTDHGALTGLDDDDHPQYALADGSRGAFDPKNAADDAVAVHVADIDPHGDRAYADSQVTAEQSRAEAVENGIAADLATETARAEAAELLLVPLAQKGAANGVAPLGSGSKIDAAFLSSIAVSDFLGTVASQAAMLALTGERGDWAIRSDLSATFILIADDASVLGNWKQLPTPTDVVLSVDGRVGVVTLSDLYDAIGAAATAQAFAIQRGNHTGTQLLATISDAGTAAAANKVAAGNPGVLDATDPTTTNARTPTAHAASHVTGGGDTIASVVASGNAGLMTGTDKAKLDGIEAGATADQTAAEILTKLLTVDGSGSGLDADLLDGISSAGFDAAGSATTAVSNHVAAVDPHGDRAYADSAIAAYIAAQNVEVFKGVIDCSTNPNYPAADAGHTYVVSVAGKIGGASGPNVEAKDSLLCLVDGTVAGTEVAVGANWAIIQKNIDGAVVGPTSATDNALARFDGTSGHLIKTSSAVAQSEVTNLVSDLAAKAPLSSPALTGNPTAPTPTAGDNDTSIATSAFVLANALTTPTSIKTGTYAIAAGDLVKANTSAGGFTATLPTTPADKTLCAVLLVTAGNTLTVACGGSAKFNSSTGVTSKAMATANQLLLVQYQASGDLWLVLIDVLASLNDGTYITIDTATAGQAKPQLADDIGAKSFKWLDGGVLSISVDYMTTGALAAGTYSNGSSGVGATFTVTATGALAAIDGETPALNDVVFVAHQASQFQNGPYVVSNPGAAGVQAVLTRLTQIDSAADLASAVQIHIAKGIMSSGKIIVVRGGTYTMGTTSIPATRIATLGDVLCGTARDRLAFYDDFDGFDTFAGTTGQRLAVGRSTIVVFSGTGAGSITQLETTEVQPGVVDLPTGTTTTGLCMVTLGPNVAFDSNKRWEMFFRPKIPTLSDGTQTFGVKIGFIAGINGAPADGVYWQARSGQANWDIVCRAGSTETAVDSGITQTTGFRNLQILCNGDGQVHFYSGGVEASNSPIGTNIPTAAMSAQGHILKSAGTVSRSLRFDTMSVDMPNSRANFFVQ